MRRLASVVEIETCDPIPETDRLSVATMKGKGWRIVTARDEYKPGDLAVMFEIDSFLDPKDDRYAFLKERCLKRFVSKGGSVLREGIRIKTCKLRGVISQGLLIPLSAYVGEGKEISVGPDGKELFFYEPCENGDEYPEVAAVKVVIEEGTDLTELLNVSHYDEVKEQLTPVCGGSISADAYGKFPSDYIPKSDEERIQNLANWCDTKKDRTWEVTCKDDGSSCTIFYSPTVDGENPFGVCSRNLRLKDVTASGVVPAMWLMAKKYLVEEKLKALYETEGKEYAIQGEYVAPGLQKNRDKYLEPEWHVFRIWDIKESKFVSPDERRAFCERNNLPHVNVVARKMPVFQKFTTVDEILKFAEGKTARGNEREGLVFKTDDGLEPQLSFKAVSNRYLMKSED